VNYSDVGASGLRMVHDVWRQKDIGAFSGSFQGKVGVHDVILLQLMPAGKHPQLSSR
jgi:hypothetical protein